MLQSQSVGKDNSIFYEVIILLNNFDCSQWKRQNNAVAIKNGVAQENTENEKL
jgi:hypothetical protein